MGRRIAIFLKVVLLLTLGILLVYVLNQDLYSSTSSSILLRDYFLSKAVEETGSINLISSIYLGYRAFDTLGETIVMLVSVLGVISILGAEE